MKSFLFALGLVLLHSLPSVRASVLAGPLTNTANGHPYYLLNTNTWTASEAEAVTLGGHLVTINDASEQDWVYTTFANYGGIGRDLWLGLTDRDVEGTFTWVNGEPVTYSNWIPGEPNNLNNEDYVQMTPPGHPYRGRWNDNSAEAFSNGVVEVVPVSTHTPGTLRWKFTMAGASTSPVAVGPDGAVYAAGGYHFYKLDGRTGSLIWDQNYGIGADPMPVSAIVVATSGVLVLRGLNYGAALTLRGLDSATGNRLWDYSYENGTDSGLNTSSWPAVGQNGLIYLLKAHGRTGSSYSDIVALHPRTGEVVWDPWVGVEWPGPPPNLRLEVGADGTVYCNGGAGTSIVNGDGGVVLSVVHEVLGLQPNDATLAGWPSVRDPDSIYKAGTHLITRSAKTGERGWELIKDGDTFSEAACSADGVVYSGTASGTLYAITATNGMPVWTFPAGGEISSPAFGPEGVVCFSAGSNVYALWTSSTSPTGPGPWPVFGANCARTGAFPSTGPLEITRQPRSIRTPFGTATFLEVAANGAWPRTYQWYLNGSTILNATSSFLKITSPSQAEQGSYRVTISNQYGSVQSDDAYLRVASVGTPEIRADGDLMSSRQPLTRAGQVTVAISSSYPGGYVFYTLDGSAPGASSLLYSKPFTLTNTATIRAIAYSSDLQNSQEDGPYPIDIVPSGLVTTAITGNGKVALYPQSTLPGKYALGTNLRVTPVPDEGWRFGQWLDSPSAPNPQRMVAVLGNTNLSAVFERIPSHEVKVWTKGGGAGAGGAYYEKTLVYFTPKPSPGWQFMNWQGDATGDQVPLLVVANRAHAIEAAFGTGLGAIVAGSGSVLFDPPLGPYPYGSQVTATALPMSGQYLARWSGAASGTFNPATCFITNANTNVYALFSPIPAGQSLLTLTINGQGTVTADPPRNLFGHGELVTLTAHPNTEQYFQEWSGDVSGTDNPLVLSVVSNLSVIANFGSNPAVSVSISTSPVGLQVLVDDVPFISPVVMSWVEGSVHTISVPSPQVAGRTRYVFKSWQDGGPQTQSYTTSSTSTSLRAAFDSQYALEVVVTPPAGGTVTVEPEEPWYEPGSAVTLTAQGGVGSVFSSWSGDLSGNSNPALLVMNAGKLVTATFAKVGPPVISHQPTAQAVVVGATAVLSVIVTGVPPIGYQWEKDGTNILNATNSTLELSHLQLDDAGLYAVVVSNVAGSVTSNPAQISVQPVPADLWLETYAGVTIIGTPGGTYTIEYTTNVDSPMTWQSLTNVVLTSETNVWIDLESPGFPKRYYRAIAVPR